LKLLCPFGVDIILTKPVTTTKDRWRKLVSLGALFLEFLFLMLRLLLRYPDAMILSHARARPHCFLYSPSNDSS
jgi:hypothetical protein